jgi:hypothetical protein
MSVYLASGGRGYAVPPSALARIHLSVRPFQCPSVYLLRRSDALSPAATARIYRALAKVVVASGLPESAWYTAAEAAVAAIYALHPAPHELSAAILRRVADDCLALGASVCWWR